MRFYKLTATVTNDIWEREEDSRYLNNDVTALFKESSDLFFDRIDHKAFFFVSRAKERDRSIEIGIIDVGLKNVEDCIRQFTKLIGIEVARTEVKEVTFETLRNMLSAANRYDFIWDDDDILEKFDLSGMTGRWRNALDFGENIIEDASEEAAYEMAKENLVEETAVPELKRIYSTTKKSTVAGHPVHYLLETDDKDIRREGARMLLKALYSAGRIRNRRYCYTNISPTFDFPQGQLEALYKCGVDGALIIRFTGENDEDGEYATELVRNIEVVSELMVRYRNQVLTILCFPQECTRLKKMLYENLANLSLIEIKEELVSGERAKDYLKMLARKNSIRTDKRLFEKLADDKGYLAQELTAFFNEWYDRKLKTTVYPQYSGVQSVKREVAKDKPRGSAFDELMQLIGLSEAKKVIDDALNYFKAQKVFADKGMKSEKASMHMVFTGNPGSAKTTVARLFSQIMKENNLLSKGHLVEVGRGDLVGQYVGWTAKTVQKKFKEADGGVLFIDEAYSLVDSKDGSFGDEAINTIVQEMENRRDSVVVIFAGYPDKMEKFLQKNPGLRSRIAFHVPFADYNPDELVEIADLMSSKKGIILEDDAKKKMHSLFEEVSAQPDFGNGRFVRNMLEKARMAQASRLLKMDLDCKESNSAS